MSIDFHYLTCEFHWIRQQVLFVISAPRTVTRDEHSDERSVVLVLSRVTLIVKDCGVEPLFLFFCLILNNVHSSFWRRRLFRKEQFPSPFILLGKVF
jgi:hypothetical protein